ncbi:MAG: hypothetical protein IT502_15830 [Rubrivivax sp.]|nr:hypothetical protein [Rubrivivax sp.]
MHGVFRLAGIFAATCLLSTTAVEAATPGLYKPRGSAGQAASTPAKPTARTRVGPMAATIEDGRSCTTIDFEGVGNLAPIPVIEGISTPNWLGIIDEDAGGSGNFANEPSPSTVAFWLGGDPTTRNIVFENPASKVEFYYSSWPGVTMTALDESGAVLTSSFGPSNFDCSVGDPNGDYNCWWPLKVETTGNKIKTVRVTGNSNYTGIDNLKVCTTIGIESIEVTQAIQQYQTIKDLKSSLQASREPPVPIVAGKIAVARVYMNKVDNVTNVRVQLSGTINLTLARALQPQCKAEDQRRRRNGCQSIDFYFVPPEGNWDLTAKVLDSHDNVLETHDLPFKSRKTDALVLKAVSICDAKDAAGNWLCAPANALASKIGLLRKIAPTSSVTVQVTNNVVRRDVAAFASVDPWWDAAIKDVNDLYGLFDSLGDLFGTHTVYYGMIRPALPGGTGGMAHDIPARGAGSRTSATRLGVETVDEVVAHETGHTLGLRHTNTDVPVAGAAPPGCYNLAADGATDWAFANNRIQSAARLEVGFDVLGSGPRDPDNTFDILSYCVPRWISPQRYKTALAALGGGAVNTPSTAPRRASRVMARPNNPRSPLTAGGAALWTVSGTIVAGQVQFDPLFDDAAAGAAGDGSGSHRMEAQSGAGAVLATRWFTPTQARSETTGPDIAGQARFYELLPVVAGAARIVVYDATNVPIGQILLGGVKPTVTVTQPSAGVLAGQQSIAWTVVDPDSASHTAKVYYSPDGGATWSQIGRVSNGSSLQADFDALPGGNGTARVMVSVSDGVNSSSGLSAAFSVPKKGPTAQITSPVNDQVFPPNVMVQLEANAYDVDDGMLDGAKVSWQSSVGGFLGTGAVLQTSALGKGTQLITMTATDRDGNSASAFTTVHVAGAPPTLDLTITGLDQLPTTCVEATIDPRPDPGGVGLKRVEYSLNGGQSWTSVGLNRLPFKVLVPGSGYIHFVARAYDLAEQAAAKDAKFIINSECAQGGTPRLIGSVFSQGYAQPGIYYVDLMLKNSGAGVAKGISIGALQLRTLAGSGSVAYNTSLSLPLPIAIPDLPIGQSSTVRLHFDVPAAVTRFSVTESGTLQDKFGRPMSFSTSQSVIPK